jgi:hypothetical protein
MVTSPYFTRVLGTNGLNSAVITTDFTHNITAAEAAAGSATMTNAATARNLKCNNAISDTSPNFKIVTVAMELWNNTHNDTAYNALPPTRKMASNLLDII